MADQKCFERILKLFDENSFSEIGAFVKSGTGDAEVITGYGYINGTPVYAFSQNSDVNNGAMGKIHADKIKKIYDLAAKTGLPVVGIYDCGGAYIEEGISALAGYGELLAMSNGISGVVPQIAVIAGNCTGCSAILAATADVVIANKEADIRISPNGAKSANDALKNGVANIVTDDVDAAISSARDIISVMPINNLEAVPSSEVTEPTPCSSGCFCSKILDGAGKIKISAGFGKNVGTLFARVNGVTVGVINYKAKGEEIGADDCVKASRFIRMCDSFSIPVVSFVDATRFGDESDGEIRNAAMLANAYSESTTAKITVIYGYACGAVFSTVASKNFTSDYIIALDDSKISVVAPKAAALVLYPERRAAGETLEKLASEYEVNNCSPLKAASEGFIDDVVSVDELRNKLASLLEILSSKRVTNLDKKHSNIPL